jgi:hypothetical protein
MTKDTTITINGINYSNVIKIKTELINAGTNIPGQGILIANVLQNISSYYSPNFGLLKQDFYLSIYPAPVAEPTFTKWNQNKSTILLNATLN